MEPFEVSMEDVLALLGMRKRKCSLFSQILGFESSPQRVIFGAQLSHHVIDLLGDCIRKPIGLPFSKTLGLTLVGSIPSNTSQEVGFAVEDILSRGV